MTFMHSDEAQRVLDQKYHSLGGGQIQIKQAWDRETSHKKILDEKERKVFVVSLPHDVTENDLQQHFVKFGEIEEIRIIKNKEENVMRGFGFVLFADRIGYIRVFEEGANHVINGKNVRQTMTSDRM